MQLSFVLSILCLQMELVLKCVGLLNDKYPFLCLPSAQAKEIHHVVPSNTTKVQKCRESKNIHSPLHIFPSKTWAEGSRGDDVDRQVSGLENPEYRPTFCQALTYLSWQLF